MRKIYFLLSMLIISETLLYAQPLYYRSAADGDWNNASTWEISNDNTNWTPASSPPNSANPSTLDIMIDHTVTVSTDVTADEVFVDTSGKLRITANTFTVANGGEPFDIFIGGGALELTGGQIIGAGKINVGKTLNWSGGTNAAQTTVDTSGTMNITGTVILQNIITVNGIANHNNGSILFQNGTIIVNNIWNENPVSNNQFTNSSGTNLLTVSSTGVFNKLGATNLTNFVPTNFAGMIDVQAGTYTIAGNTTSTGTLNIEDPAKVTVTLTLYLEAVALMTGEGDLEINGGILNVETDVELEDITLIFTAGTIDDLGTGSTILIEAGEGEDDMIWSGGTSKCPLIVGTGANLSITGSTGPVSLQDDLTNNGVVTQYTAIGVFSDGSGVDITNLAEWTTNSDAVVSITNNGAGNDFINSGTFNKNGTGTFNMNLPTTMGGTWNINAGVYNCTNITVCTGNIDIDAGATFQKTNTFNFESGSSVTGLGNFNQTAGTTNFNTNIATPATITINISGGVTDGPSTLTSGGIFNWSGGTVGNPFINDVGATANISNSVSLQDDFTNNGVVNQTATAITCFNGEIDNNAIWTTNTPTVATISNSGGINSFTNDGTFNKDGTATFNINITSNLNGLVNVNSGSLVLGGITTCTAVIDIDAGATFQKTNTFYFETGSSVTGSGNFNQTGGTTNFNTDVTTPSTLTVNFSGGITDGPENLTIGGAIFWTGTTIANHVIIAAAAIANISNNVALQDQFTNNGTVNHTAGNINCTNATIYNDGDWNANNASPCSINNTSGANYFISVQEFGKEGAATYTIAIPVDFDGPVDIDGGKLVCSNLTTCRDVIDIGAGCTFEKTNTFNCETGCSWTGSGNFNQTGGTTNFNTDVTTPSTLTVNFSGGITDGPENLTIGGAILWTGTTVANHVIIAAAAIANISNNVALQDQFTNNGTVNHTAGNINCTNATITNNATWTSNITGFWTFVNTTGTNHFTNNGTFNKSGTGTLTNNIPSTFNGPSSINGGTYLCGNASAYKSSIFLNNNAILRTSHTIHLEPGSSFGGSGVFNMISGILNVNTETTVPSSVTVNVSGGVANGTSTGKIQGTLNWSGGLINFPCEVNIANITADVNLHDELKIEGTANHSAGNISCSDAQIVNNGTWTSNITGFWTFVNTTGTNHFTNNGTFNKSGTGTLANNIPSTYNGPSNINGGTYLCGNASAYKSSIFLNNNAILRTSHTIHLDPGSSFGGSGIFDIISGIVNVNTDVTIPAGVTVNMSGGMTDGTNLLTLLGTANISGGNIGSPTKMANGATLHFTTASTITLSDGLVNDGAIIFLAQALNFLNGTLTNNGNINLNATSTSSFGNTSGTNLITNTATGTIHKNNATTFASHIPLNNLGSILVNLGTLSQQNNITHTGNLNIGGVIAKFLCDGIFACGIGNIIGGNGTFTINSGTLAVDAPTEIPANVRFELNAFARTIGTALLTIGQRMFWAGEIGSPVTVGAQAVLDMIGAPVLKSHLKLEGIGNLPNVAVNFANGIFEILANGSLNVISTGGNSTFGSLSGTNQFYIRAGAFLRKSGAQFFANFIPTDLDGEWETLDGTSLQHGILNVVGKLKVATNKIMRFSEASIANFNTGAQAEGTGTYEFNGVCNFNALFQFLTGSNVTFEKGTMQGTGPVKLGGVTQWRGGNFNVNIIVPALGETRVTSVNLPRLTEKVMTVETNGTFRIQQSGNGSLGFDNASLKVGGNLIYSPSSGSNFTFSNTSGTNSVEFLVGGSLTNTSPTSIFNVNIPISTLKKVGGLGTNNFNGPIPSAGIYSPGMSPGIITINSTSPMFGDSSILEIEMLDGSGAGTGHDQLQRNGNLVLDGSLSVLQTGTVPLGTYIIINLTSGTISGSFDVLNLPPGYTSGHTSNTFFVTKIAAVSWTFRSKQNGNWNDISTWELSADGINWSNATQVPSLYNAELITIRGPHIVTLDTNTVVKELVLENGAFLNVAAGTLLISN